MGFTKEKIYNLVLNNLGVTAIVQNTTEVTPKVTTLNNYYDIALEQVSKDFDWNFLNRKEALTLISEKSPDPKYLFAYDYPNDCIAARSVVDKAGGEYKKFDVTTSKNGSRIIVCNIQDAVLNYTRKIQTQMPEAYFPSEFVTALAFYLAFLTADAIVGNTQKKQMNYQSYQIALAKAKAMSANESEKKDQDDRNYTEFRN